jgi:RNase H-like domain found in reverse transcriptase
MDTIKRALTTDPILRLPDFDKPFVITTDWSQCAIGAVLSQFDEVTQFDHPVAFASRLLNVHERKYSAT